MLDNWTGKEINSQAVGLCFGWQLDVHTTCARKANMMWERMMVGVDEIQDESVSKFLGGKKYAIKKYRKKRGYA